MLSNLLSIVPVIGCVGSPAGARFHALPRFSIPRAGNRFFHILGVCILFVILSGCRLGYVLDAGIGQWRLLSGSRPLEELRKEGAIAGGKLASADLVLDVKQFGESKIGLRKTGNYSSMYVGPSLSHIFVLSASPKDRLQLKTWWFPIIGRIPYLGFFDEKEALEEQRLLQSRGMDTYLRTSNAYSTLGWFKDPITPAMLNHRPARIVEIVLHELTHATLYEKGQSAFNEGLAVLVGVIGAELYCRGRWGPDDPETLYAADTVHDQKLFSEFLSRFLDRLSEGYQEGDSSEEALHTRSRLFAQGIREFQKLTPRLKTDRFSSFDKKKLNNAYLLTLGLYFRSYSDFEALYRVSGNDLKKTVAVCQSLASSGNEDDLMQGIRNRIEGHSTSAQEPEG